MRQPRLIPAVWYLSRLPCTLVRGKHIPGLSVMRAHVLVLTHVVVWVIHSAQHLSIFRGSAGSEPSQMSLKGDVNESQVCAAVAHVWPRSVFQPLRDFCVVWAFDRSGFEEGRKFLRKVFVQREGVAAVRLNRSQGRYAAGGLARIHKLDGLDSARIRQNKRRFRPPRKHLKP